MFVFQFLELRISQSTVHRRLSELERRIGRPLVTRHASGYRLTPFDEELKPCAERVEAGIAELECHVADDRTTAPASSA